MRKLLLIGTIAMYCHLAWTQGGIIDTLIRISEVEIRANTIFEKSEAGMKETQMDSALLKQKASRSLSELLAENTTVYIKDYGRGALSTASFRGAAVSHTQVSWNGIAINSPMSGIVDFSLIPLYIVDELSLQHGAASIPYRSGGLGGHVSIGNKVDWDNRFSGRYYQGVGSFSSYDEFAQINLGNSGIQAKTRVYHSASRNNYTYTNTSLIERPVQQLDGGDYRKKGLMQEIYHRPTPKTSLSAKVWYQDAERSIPLVMSYEGVDTTLDKQNSQSDKTLKAVIDGAYYGDKVLVKVASGIDYQQLDYLMKILISGSDESKPVNSTSDMLALYNKMSLKYDLNSVFSADLKANYNFYSITTLDSSDLTGYEASRHEVSLYGGLYANPIKPLNLSLGIRMDHVSDMQTPLIYSLGASYRPFASKELVLKASFARNFHNPSLNHLYWQPGGNPNLLPEEGYTGEAGIHHILKGKIFTVENQITAYYSDINNWILWLPGFKGYWEALNVSKVKSYGFEFQTKLSLQAGKNSLNLIANYVYSKSLNYGDALVAGDDSKGMQLPFIPVHSGNTFLRLNRSGFFLNYQYQYCGIRHLLSSNRMGLMDDSEYFGAIASDNPYYRLYAQHLNHLSTGKSLSFKKMSLSLELKINNLFNETYRNILNRYMPGRYYTLLLKIDF